MEVGSPHLLAGNGLILTHHYNWLTRLAFGSDGNKSFAMRLPDLDFAGQMTPNHSSCQSQSTRCRALRSQAPNTEVSRRPFGPSRGPIPKLRR